MMNDFLRRQKFRLLNNNPLVWYKKSFLARKILNASPQSVPQAADLEIHVLACSKDFLCLLWALRSFYFYAGNVAALRIHDDGTLQSWQFDAIGRLFPGSRTFSKSQSDKDVVGFLAPYPNCLKSRLQSFYMIKVFDFFLFSQAKRIILLDSDVLFFERPIELLAEGRQSVFNADIWTNYVYSPREIEKRFGRVVPEKVNVGVGAMNKDCFDLESLEKILNDDGLRATPFITDQTLITILASPKDIRLLGPEYKISLSRGLANTVSKHYTRLVRYLFYLEGLPHLVASGILR
jgi:hypothetical protein